MFCVFRLSLWATYALRALDGEVTVFPGVEGTMLLRSLCGFNVRFPSLSIA